MVQRSREWLTILLIGLLPLHALLVTVLTKMLLGAGNAPLPLLALWKEALLAVILILALIEIVQQMKKGLKEFLAPDKLDVCILALLLLSVVVGVFTQEYWKQYLLGFKYDFVPLLAFMILRRVPWTERCLELLIKVILWVGGAVALYGFLGMALPMEYFRALGYSDLHSLYLPGGPLAAFQQLGDSGLRRIQSTLSGPNQLGLWLLLPWSFGIVLFFSAWFRAEYPLLRFGAQRTRSQQCMVSALYLLLIGTAIFITFSRTAWIAAGAIAVVFILKTLPKPRAKIQLVRLLGVGGMLLILLTVSAPATVVRLASTRDHLLKPLAAVGSVARYPFGQGLGTAGPASNRFSDACVFLDSSSDPSWAEDRQELCVFVGETQVQPQSRTCTCPFVTENWYLQIAVEMGVLGFMIYIIFTISVLVRLYSSSAVFLPFLGISTAGLFLHSWESGAVAYTLWILVAIQLTSKRI